MTWLWALAVIAACGGGGGGGGGGATDGTSSGGTSSGGSSSGAAPATYAVGGTLSGLAGAGLVLQNGGGDDLSPTANGPFKFATRHAEGAAYAVTVKASPPAQACSVSHGSGTVGTADVTTVAVVCAGKTFKIGGKVTGLSGTLVLQDNGGDDLTLTADGAFTFATGVAQDAGYAVTVKTQPAGQTCTIAAATGVANRDITGVVVTCAASAYPVGATVVGLTGTLVLQDNGGDDLTVTADGKVTFPTALADGSNYAVTVKTQPTGQTCQVAIGTGKVSGAAVNVAIACAASHTLFVTATGVAGEVNILNNGTVIFGTTGNIFDYAVLSNLIDGTPYVISAAAPKNYHCSVKDGSGTVSGADVHVTVACGPDVYSVGGTVVGLAAGETVVLQNNAKDDISITGATFTFPTRVAVGGSFDVTIKTQPSTQTCTVSNGSGLMGTADCTDAVVTCSAVTYAVRGVALGLTAPVVLQINGAGDTTVAKDGGFTLSQRLPDAAAYLVTVKSSGPGQSCDVKNGSGTIAAADVGTVNILCSAVTARRAYVARPGSLRTYPLDGTTGAFGLPTSTVASGPGPMDVVVAPDGKHLFVTDAVWSSVSSYAIDAVGDPSFVASFATGKRPFGAAVDPSSRFVYTANSLADSVSGFAIDAVTGKLTEAPGSPVNVGSAPASITIDPSGARLFETDATSVYGFTIGADGALTSLAGTPFKFGVAGFGVSPDGKWGFGTDRSVYYVMTWIMDSSGAPSARAPGLPAVKVQGNVWGPPVLDPTGKHLYQTTRGTQSSPGMVYAFTVGANGGLTPVAGSPFTAGTWAQKTVVEPSGRFVYVANTAEMDISAFARDAVTGALTPVAGGPMANDFNPTPASFGATSFALSP